MQTPYCEQDNMARQPFTESDAMTAIFDVHHDSDFEVFSLRFRRGSAHVHEEGLDEGWAQ